MNEQELINLIFQELSAGKDISKHIDVITKKFRKSVFLQYYLAVFYEKNNNIPNAEQQYKKCINIEPSFLLPYVNLCYHLVNRNDVLNAYKTILPIFCKKTMDPTSGLRSKKFLDIRNNLKICSILGPALTEYGDKKKAKQLYTKMISEMKNIKNEDLEYYHLEGWKNICKMMGILYQNYDQNKSLEYYKMGLDISNSNNYNFLDMENNLLKGLDINLVTSYILMYNYCDFKTTKFDLNLNNYFNYEEIKTKNSIIEYTSLEEHLEENFKYKKIKIGYLSPDFNKNAVGYFIKTLLKYFDSNKFEVYCYYNNSNKDEMTETFLNYPNINWYFVSDMEDTYLYNLMKNHHKIDILVDLICHGVGNRLKLITMKPAPIIINYLGFPDSSRLTYHNFRLTDKIVDPTVQTHYTEKLLYMPRSFLCWDLFDNINHANINYSLKNDQTNEKIYLGIMNRISKHNKIIRDVWKNIISKDNRFILCFKLGFNETPENTDLLELYSDFPKENIKFLPFTDTLDEYFEQFNYLDLCIDTYPYSGTTTTCSSLYMGVPVICIYDKSNPHVSNVSASILLNMNNINYKKYICKDLIDYENKILSFKKSEINMENENRNIVRQDFLNLMNPNKFILEYEEILTNLLNTDTNFTKTTHNTSWHFD